MPPLRRQPPAVYGEHGVVYVHAFTVSRPARKTKGHVMLQSLNHLTLAVSDLQKASPSGTSCWGLRCTPAGIPGPISPAAICGSACRTTRRASMSRRRRATTPITRLPWRKRILNRSRTGWSRRASSSGSRTKARGRRSIFSTRTGTSWSCTWAASPRGWRRVARSPMRAWCLPQTGLEARTFSLPASVTCVAASS